ncbi:MAG: hypothetical protein ACI4HM_10115 [Ruminococcus sp.]
MKFLRKLKELKNSKKQRELKESANSQPQSQLKKNEIAFSECCPVCGRNIPCDEATQFRSAGERFYYRICRTHSKTEIDNFFEGKC